LSSLGFAVKRPVVIRLAALQCSDFPLLSLTTKAIARLVPLQGIFIVTDELKMRDEINNLNVNKNNFKLGV